MNLERLTITNGDNNQIRDLIPDEEGVKFVKTGEEPVFILADNAQLSRKDDLVDLEVTFRKGRRVGLFTE